jgi:hypothetical protein
MFIKEYIIDDMGEFQCSLKKKWRSRQRKKNP